MQNISYSIRGLGNKIQFFSVSKNQDFAINWNSFPNSYEGISSVSFNPNSSIKVLNFNLQNSIFLLKSCANSATELSNIVANCNNFGKVVQSQDNLNMIDMQLLSNNASGF